MTRRVALTATIVVEDYDDEGNLTQAGQPEQVQPGWRGCWGVARVRARV